VNPTLKHRHIGLIALFFVGLIAFSSLSSIWLLSARRAAAIDAATQWAQEQYTDILIGEPIDDVPTANQDADQLLVRSFYYSFFRPAAGPQEATGSIWEGGSESLVAWTVGAAEGTRGPDGSYNPAWHGHEDPCKAHGACPNRGLNMGTFSYDGAATPEEADAQYLPRLQREAAQIKETADAIGLEMSLVEFLNAIDLANQAPLAALGDMGYPERLLEAKNNGLTGRDAIVWARSHSFKDPNRGFALNAPGLGNTMSRVKEDQDRRARQIEAALANRPEFQSGTVESQSGPKMEEVIEQLKSTGAMQELRNGLYRAEDGSWSVKRDAFTRSLNYLKVCDWSQYGCDLQPPDGSSPEIVYNDFLWELGYAQGVREADAPPTPEPTAATGAKFITPLNMTEAVLTSHFGWRTLNGLSRMHEGTDFGAETGTTIMAAADGTVVHSGPLGSYGITTILDHGDYKTLYAHNSGNLFPVGVAVKQGAPIAKVGSTGRSTGPHLHFEIIPNGQDPVNPCKYLDVC